MKRKENLSLGRKKLVVLLVTLVMVISSLLTACGSSAAETTPETKEEVAAVDKEEVQAEVEETKQEEAVQETAEEVEQNTQEVETFQSAGEWAQSVERTEPKMTIWNEITKEGIILENEQKYSLKEGDLLVICTKEKNSGIEINSDISSSEFKSRSSSNYTQFMFNKVFLEETLFEFIVTVAGTDYPFSLTFIPENAVSTDAEVSETTQASGKVWVSSLEYAEPKLVVWNDTTGTKEVIEQGGKYVMQQGDTLGIYCPTDYFLYNTLPIDVAEGTTVVSNVVVIELNLPSKSQDINLEAELMNPQQEFVTYSYVITTP